MSENQIFLNCLVKWVGTAVCERLLCWHVPEQSYYFIAVEEDNACPFIRTKAEVDDALKTGKLIVLEEDHLILGIRLEEDLSKAQKLCQDAAWKLIKELVEDKQHLVMDRRYSGRLIREAANKHSKHVTTVYKHLRRYWQRGQTKAALQPDFPKCGHPLKPRVIGEVKLGDLNDDGSHVGINVTPEVKDQFRGALNDFYFTEDRLPFVMVFKKLLAAHYAVGYEVINGATAPIIAGPDKRPSFAQFRYFYDTNYRKTEALRKRLGNRRFDQNFREVTRDQTKTALGIGDIYQIDATTADVYLVLSGNKNIVVGRPVVYLVIDVFSTLVTGLHVTFMNMSYDPASMAIWNAYSDKVAFCAKYGVTGISPEHWPARGLPTSLFADRGELLGCKTDHITESLNIPIANAPAFCPTAKAIVERHFGLLNQSVIDWLPGAVPDSNADKDGKADYRKKAALTQEEFTEALIRAILAYNICVRPDYIPTDEMIADDATLSPAWSPAKIWAWEVKRGKRLRDMDPRLVRLRLLPMEEGLVTPEGIKFNNLHYTCNRARLEEWFSSIRAKKRSWKVRCSFDPNSVDRIFLVGKSMQDTDLCELTTACSPFAGWSWASVTTYHKLQNKVNLAQKKGDLAVQVATQAQLDAITEKANNQREENGPANVDHMAAAKQVQKAAEQKQQSADLNKVVGSQPKPAAAAPKPEPSKVTSAWVEACKN